MKRWCLPASLTTKDWEDKPQDKRVTVQRPCDMIYAFRMGMGFPAHILEHTELNKYVDLLCGAAIDLFLFFFFFFTIP